MARSSDDDEYSAPEARRRLAATLRGAQVVGHKPQSAMKLGKARKPTAEHSESPTRAAPVEKRR